MFFSRFNVFPLLKESLEPSKDLFLFMLKLFSFLAAVGVLNIEGSVAFDDVGQRLFYLHWLLIIITDQYRLLLFLFHILYY
jgi:hypothetical protein